MVYTLESQDLWDSIVRLACLHDECVTGSVFDAQMVVEYQLHFAITNAVKVMRFNSMVGLSFLDYG